MRPLVIGSRASRLALAQTEIVASEIRRLAPGLEITITRISTAGDRNRRTPLDRIPDVGFFVKELEEALADKRIDIAVHSLKDLPTDLRDGLSIAAVPERADPRDVFISKSGKLAGIPAGAKIGTSSVRRAIQLAAVRPDLEMVGLRGNVDTRVRKVESGNLDGVIMAAAGLIRLGWQDRITEYLSPEQFLPPAGQGALAIEIRSADSELAALLAPLNHQPTWQAVTAERAFLKELGGGCRAPIAALGRVANDVLKLSGMVAGPQTKHIVRASLAGGASDPQQAGVALAALMRSKGASEILNEVRTGEGW